MKRTLMAAAAAVLALSGGAGALAQPYGHGPDRDHGDRGGYDRHDNGRHEGYDRGEHAGYDRGQHVGWRDDWRPGHRIDRDYWRRGERIDWREHHLRRPPRGYEWREVDGRYVLAAAATGLIASIIANSR